MKLILQILKHSSIHAKNLKGNIFMTVYVWNDYPRKNFCLATGEYFISWAECEEYVKRTNPVPYWIDEFSDRLGQDAEGNNKYTKEKFLEAHKDLRRNDENKS